MSAQDEMDRTILELERQVDRLKAIRAQQIMQVTASPRVVAGPLRLVETTARKMGLNAVAGDSSGILTHPTCAIPGAVCDDDGRPDAA